MSGDKIKRVDIKNTGPHPMEGAGMPTIFINAVNIMVNPILTRLVLGEQLPEQDGVPRVAVCLPTEAAEALAKEILKYIEQNRASLRPAGSC